MIKTLLNCTFYALDYNAVSKVNNKDTLNKSISTI